MLMFLFNFYRVNSADCISETKEDIHSDFKILSYLFYFNIFSHEVKIKICNLYTAFLVFIAKVWCYIAMLNVEIQQLSNVYWFLSKYKIRAITQNTPEHHT